MTHLGRNQVVDLHKQKLFQSQILIKDSDTFLKIHFSSGVIVTFLL